LKEEKLYVLKNKELRMEIIWLHHNISVAEYSGKWKTTELVARDNERCGTICVRE